MDAQHQHLFELYNRVAASSEGLDQQALGRELLEYAAEHFRAEEAYMVDVGYPEVDRDIHHIAHASFLRRLTELSEEPLFSTLDFIREWLLRHIMTDDRKIGDFVRTHPRKA